MWFFLCRTALVLLFALLAVLLVSVAALFVKKYRRYLPKVFMIYFGLFAALVFVDLVIYWDISAGGHWDMDPLPDLLLDSLNLHVPGMVLLIAAVLILTRKTKKSVPFWICLACAVVLICGFFVLAYHVFFNNLAQDLSSIDVWWI